MASVFLLGIFWKKTTTRAANFALTAGTVFCLGVGILYLWPPTWLTAWLTATGIMLPHFMMLSFDLFVILVIAMIIISLTDSDKTQYEIPTPVKEERSKLAISLWIALAIVMIGLYIYFN